MEKFLKFYHWLLAGITAGIALLIMASAEQARPESLVPAIILITVAYLWSHERLGRWWSLMPPFLLAFSPILLSQKYHPADAGLAAAALLSVYAFNRFLDKPSRSLLVVSGLAFGAAWIFSPAAVLLAPLPLFLISVFFIASVARDWRKTAPLARIRRFGIRTWRYYRAVFLIFLIGYFLVYGFYYLNEPGYSIRDFVSDVGLVFTFNAPFFSLGEGGRLPLSFFSQNPYSASILIGLAFLISLYGAIKKMRAFGVLKPLSDYLGVSFEKFSMMSFVFFCWLFSLTTLGVYVYSGGVLMILPFAYILTASGLKRWASFHIEDARIDLAWLFKTFSRFFGFFLKISAVVILLVWYLFEAMASISY